MEEEDFKSDTNAVIDTKLSWAQTSLGQTGGLASQREGDKD